MTANPDPIEAARREAYTRYLEGFKPDNKAKREAELKKITELAQKQVAQTIKEMQP